MLHDRSFCPKQLSTQILMNATTITTTKTMTKTKTSSTTTNNSKSSQQQLPWLQQQQYTKIQPIMMSNFKYILMVYMTTLTVTL